MKWSSLVLSALIGGVSSTAAAQAVNYPIKVNTTRPTHSLGQLTHTCQYFATTDDAVSKPIDSRRDFNFTSMTSSRRTQFYNSLVASSVPGASTNQRANINFKVQGDAFTGLLINDDEGSINLEWNACIDLEVVHVTTGDTRRLTFYWDEDGLERDIEPEDPCYRGEAGEYQHYEQIETDLSGYVYFAHGHPFGAVNTITDDVTLGGAFFDAFSSGLPNDGLFVDHWDAWELAAAEDALEDFDVDGAANEHMPFLFGTAVGNVNNGAVPATELLNYRVQLWVTGELHAYCSTDAGSGEQGHVEVDTEQAYLSFVP